MRGIYISIVLLVLYGDILKRYISGITSLVILYGFALAILVYIIFKTPRKKYLVDSTISKHGIMVSRLACALILLYFLQLITSVNESFFKASVHAVYMCVPLLYIYVIHRKCPQFRIDKLGHVFLVLMLPINFVGFVQYFYDPSYLISTVYSGDLGGVIYRNFLIEKGMFSRYPSLFTSADRYSGMGLMQLFFSLSLIIDTNKITTRKSLWIAFNIIISIIVLFIAGARSRILIGSFALIISAAVYLYSQAFITFKVKHTSTFKIVGSIMLMVVILGGILINYHNNPAEYPIARFMTETFEKKDVSSRIGQAVERSQISTEISLFGSGLGSVGNGGKPGEFGIESMWKESGLIWGSLMLVCVSGILAILIIRAWMGIVRRKPVLVALYLILVGQLLSAMLLGFTSVFELSQGILLGCILAVITKSRSQAVRYSK